MLNLDQLTVQLWPYKVGKASDCLKDIGLLRQVQGFRRQLGRLMYAYDRDTAPKKLPPGDYLASIKVDGEFTVLAYDGKTAFTLNPGGTVRAGLPFHDEAARLLKKAKVKHALIAGELHVAREDGERARVHDVAGVARKPETEAALDTLHFAPFNIHDLDGEDLSMHEAANREKLEGIFGGAERVAPVEFVETTDAKGVMKLYNKWVGDGGAEGVVARSDSAGFYKIKPRHSLDLAVIGFSEGMDDRSGLLHDLLLAAVREDGVYHLVGRVGGGFSESDRASLLKKLQKMVVGSDFVEVNSNRVAYQMVRPEWVVEISCLDLISRTSRGATVDKMVLSWDGGEKLWKGVRRLPLASILSPQFVRLRDDKKPSVEDTGLDQISRTIELPEAERRTADLQLPTSTVMRRAVATKELKGAVMVRKLLMWKTNKEEADALFPPYVLHLTDYSPNRKTPLDHEIRVSSSEKQIHELWKAWESKYFVGGWVLQD